MGGLFFARPGGSSDLFVTAPSFEHQMPANLTKPGLKHWMAAHLSSEAPWYVFAYEVEYEGGKVPQTSLAAWESALIELIESVPPEDRRAVGRMDRTHRPGAAWDITWIETIWQAAPEEHGETGLLLFQLPGDSQMRDAFLEPVPVRGGRRLVFHAGPVPQAVSPSVTEVPEEFPRAAPDGPVPGAQPKVGVRAEGGLFTDSSAARRAERFEICKDLLDQLVAYAEHKRQSDIPLESLVRPLLQEVERKRFGWGLSPAEAEWLCGRIKEHFRTPSA